MIETRQEEINHKWDIRKVYVVDGIYRFFDYEKALKFEREMKGGLSE